MTLDEAAIWDITTPSQPRRVPGLSMAGFRDRIGSAVDLRVVPFPAVTVAIDLSDGLVIETATGRHPGGNLVVGVAPDDVRVGAPGVEALQLRLSPVLAHAVFGASPHLTGTVVTLEDLWGRAAVRLQERLRAASSWDERFSIAETELARRYESGWAVDPEVAFAWRRLARTRGQIRIDRLAAEVDWSRKRLWSRFRSQTGLTPKHAARLVRFDHAAHRLAAGQSPAWVAAECGYVDQPHLHRDAMSFTGLTPAAIAVAPWLAVDDVAWPTPAYVGPP
ncbi:MAG TPA: helix-turn-helix domain-containing protein [Jiangellaceae bacterium]|nr:helix-turn-helix domain-containing protein [Jiangellaceae bacterium]